MTSNPLVSVVIPSYGRSQFLDRAVASVVAQTHTNIEILIVDDNGIGSEHQRRTKAVVDTLSFPRIKYITNTKNGGGGYSRNVGVSNATGEFVAFLDDDDEWGEDFLSKGLSKLNETGYDVVYCDCWIVDASGKKVEINEKYEGDVWIYLLEGWCPSSTSLFIIRSSLAADCELFDANLKGFQDYDCWLGLSKRARFCYHEAPAVFKHRHELEQITTNTEARRGALDYLKEKWMARLQTEEERKSFENTTSQLDRKIVLTEYKMALHNKHFIEAARYALSYLATGRLSPRAFYNILKLLIK